MQNYSVILNNILKQISLELTTVQMKLNRINLSREDEQYRIDILRLASTNIWLLASYYVESDIEKRNKFASLLQKIMSDKEEIARVKEQLKNMYFLKQNNLLNTSQYKLAEEEVKKFVALLKYDNSAGVLEDEKKLLTKKKNLVKLSKYFSKKPGDVSVKNIDSFKKLIFDLDISEKEKTEALMLVFINDVSYYNSELEKRKFKFIITPDLYDGLKIQALKKDLLTKICRDNNFNYITITNYGDKASSNPTIVSSQMIADFYSTWDSGE